MNDFVETVIKNNSNFLGVTTRGGYVTRWSVPAIGDVLYRGSEIKRTGIPILFPRFGKGGELPNHGFARDSKWQLAQPNPDQLTMTLSNRDIAADMAALYPYAFELVVTCQLLQSPGFTYTLAVKNLSGKPMPISPGIHPYWAIEHSAKRSMVTEGIEGFDATAIDWDTNPPDNRYEYDGPVLIEFPTHRLRIEDLTETGPVIKKIVVWSQKPDMPDYNFVCFEPVCGDDMAFYENPIIIAPNTAWSMRVQFAVE